VILKDLNLSSRSLSVNPKFASRHPLVIAEVNSTSIHQNKFWIGAAMAVPEYLAGRPTKRLVKLVRMILRNYGIKPRGQQWRATWVWAHAISISYYFPHWPTAVEISTQYILLLLAEIKVTDGLKLPHRASTVIPDEVRALLSSNPVPLLIQEPVINDLE